MLKLQINRRIRVVIKTIKAEWPHYPNHSQSIMSPNKRSLDVIFRLRQNRLIANNLLHLYASVILRLPGVPESVNKQNFCLNSVQHKVCCQNQRNNLQSITTKVTRTLALFSVREKKDVEFLLLSKVGW